MIIVITTIKKPTLNIKNSHSARGAPQTRGGPKPRKLPIKFAAQQARGKAHCAKARRKRPSNAGRAGAGRISAKNGVVGAWRALGACGHIGSAQGSGILASSTTDADCRRCGGQGRRKASSTAGAAVLRRPGPHRRRKGARSAGCAGLRACCTKTCGIKASAAVLACSTCRCRSSSSAKGATKAQDAGCRGGCSQC